jgi:hypothetical protein
MNKLLQASRLQFTIPPYHLEIIGNVLRVALLVLERLTDELGIDIQRLFIDDG